jgi:phospholipid/cholesterol/gamma-HCH transport system substrate-binding protein
MKDTSLPIKVGLFVVLGIAIIGLITLFIGQYRLGSGGGYTLYAEFSDVAGLNVLGSVRIAGVQVGDVEDVILSGDRAKVVMSIATDTPVYRDARVEMKSYGALGDKYIMIYPGTPASGLLADGDTIANTVEEADINDIVKNLAEISTSIKDVVGNPETKEDLKKIVSNMENTSANLSDITGKINRGEGSLGKLMNDDTLYSDVKDVTEKVKKGEGTLGRLVQDDTLYTESENTVREFRKAAEGIEEQTPISVMSTIFGLIF